MEKKLKFIIANCCQIKPSEVNKDAGVNYTKNWDSLNHLQIMMCIEKEFNTTLDTGLIAGLTSFKDIMDYLRSIKN